MLLFLFCIACSLSIAINLYSNSLFSKNYISSWKKHLWIPIQSLHSQSYRTVFNLNTQKSTHAKTPQTCYSLLHLQTWYRYAIIAVSGCWRLQTVQNWRYQAGTVYWFVIAVSVWCNRMIQVCWEQTVAVCENGL